MRGARCVSVLVLALAVASTFPGARAAVCNSSCRTCVAAPGAERSNGIKDEHCKKCADGYKWWPCADTIDKCLCSGGGSGGGSSGGSSPPASPPSPPPSGGGTYPAAANWASCGGKSHKCGLDEPCARCADPGYECVSWEPGNEWYYQCRPKSQGAQAAAKPSPAPAASTPSRPAPASPPPVTTPASSGAAPGGSGPPSGVAGNCPSSTCSQGDLGSLLTSSQWDSLFPHRNNRACKQNKKPDGSLIQGGFYERDAFLAAARLFPCFLGRGTRQQRLTELAAFLAQISHETTGGWATAPDGPQAWGLCWKEEVGCETGGCAQYCAGGDPCRAAGEDISCPCAAGKTYHGRGPMQLSWNYNYAPAGRALSRLIPRYRNLDLLARPETITEDATLAFATAIYFWMTPRQPKPSAHNVMLGCWQPSAADLAAGRVPGFGATTNIINGALECGIARDYRVEDRVAYFERYARVFGIPTGGNLRCETQQRF